AEAAFGDCARWTQARRGRVVRRRRGVGDVDGVLAGPRRQRRRVHQGASGREGFRPDVGSCAAAEPIPVRESGDWSAADEGRDDADIPHILKSPSGLPDQVFYDQWQSSPFADEYLASMALHVAEKIGYTTGGPH